MLTRFRWSPLVQSVVNRNLFMLTNKPGTTLPKRFSGVVAAHLPRGDFEDYCRKLGAGRPPYDGWNTFPDVPDESPDEPWNLENKMDVHLEHCFPTIDQIVARLRTIRKEWQGRPLKRVYLMTNAEKVFLNELESQIRADGWESMKTTYDLDLHNDEVEVDMAAEMMIGQTAEVFVGNEVSRTFFGKLKLGTKLHFVLLVLELDI